MTAGAVEGGPSAASDAGDAPGAARAVSAARPPALPAADTRLVVVEASAGTGKTFFLEHRVVDLVLAGAELGQILLVTFTEKAVAELRLRIRDVLDRLSRTTRTRARTG
jgi:ATP-dependent exoDNAse (exonuclease V) beta subunit